MYYDVNVPLLTLYAHDVLVNFFCSWTETLQLVYDFNIYFIKLNKIKALTGTVTAHVPSQHPSQPALCGVLQRRGCWQSDGVGLRLVSV